MSSLPTPDDVLAFWFTEPVDAHWFKSTPGLDAEIRERFEPLWQAARKGELDRWQSTPRGALALAIILDQFPLNMYRGQPEGFATEAQAREIARAAIVRDFDRELDDDGKRFLYMPFMHSESPADQDESVRLFEQAGLTDNLKFAHHHREIVRRFGRFPHRNAILGRESTQEEIDFLNSPEGFNG